MKKSKVHFENGPLIDVPPAVRQLVFGTEGRPNVVCQTFCDKATGHIGVNLSLNNLAAEILIAALRTAGHITPALLIEAAIREHQRDHDAHHRREEAKRN